MTSWHRCADFKDDVAIALTNETGGNDQLTPIRKNIMLLMYMQVGQVANDHLAKMCLNQN